MPSALDRSLDTFASISWREVSADCASKGTLASGMGVGAGVGFAGEPEACWPGAVPPLKTKARIIKRIRITGCVTPAIWGRTNVFTEIARFRPARKEADAYRLCRPKVPYRWSTVPYNPAPLQANSARIVPAAAATVCSIRVPEIGKTVERLRNK